MAQATIEGQGDDINTPVGPGHDAGVADDTGAADNEWSDGANHWIGWCRRGDGELSHARASFLQQPKQACGRYLHAVRGVVRHIRLLGTGWVAALIPPLVE